MSKIYNKQIRQLKLSNAKNYSIKEYITLKCSDILSTNEERKAESYKTKRPISDTELSHMKGETELAEIILQIIRGERY